MTRFVRQTAACALLLAGAMAHGCAAPPARKPPTLQAVARPQRAVDTSYVSLASYSVADDPKIRVATAEPAPEKHAAAAAEPDNPRQRFVTDERLEQGYTIVVVGANGDTQMNSGLTPGLVAGGYPGAVESVDWTTGHWPLVVYHLRAPWLHRAGAQAIAEKVVDYQARYPGRPVNLVGYSAGAVVALEAVKALDPAARVDRVVLLAASVSPLYDLRPVLARTRLAVRNLYQPQDVPLLWAGTLLAGTSDGYHMMSAGAVGFWEPVGSTPEDRQLYRERLSQFPYRPQMALSGNLGGHFQCVHREFVSRWIAPMLTE